MCPNVPNVVKELEVKTLTTIDTVKINRPYVP